MSEPELERGIARIREAYGADAPPAIVIGAVRGDRTAIAVDGVRRRAGTGVDHDLPVGVETSFDLASVTKAIATTTALARLVAAHELSVDDPLERFVPTAPTAPGTTLRALLLHRAGLWEWWPLYADRRPPFEVLDALPLRYRPDEVRAYSDLGFVLLGRVVAAVTGSTLDEAVAQTVLDPLGMGSTRFAHPVGDDVAANAPDGDAIEHRMLATGEPYPVPVGSDAYSGFRSGTITGEVSDGNAFHAFRGISGHAGLFSTVSDLLRAAGALAGDVFLPPEVRREFFAPGPDEEQALGYRRSTIPVGGSELPLLWHPGYTGTGVGWVPDSGMGVVLLTNRLHAPGEPANSLEMWRIARDAAGEWFSRR